MTRVIGGRPEVCLNIQPLRLRSGPDQGEGNYGFLAGSLCQACQVLFCTTQSPAFQLDAAVVHHDLTEHHDVEVHRVGGATTAILSKPKM